MVWRCASLTACAEWKIEAHFLAPCWHSLTWLPWPRPLLYSVEQGCHKACGPDTAPGRFLSVTHQLGSPALLFWQYYFCWGSGRERQKEASAVKEHYGTSGGPKVWERKRWKQVNMETCFGTLCHRHTRHSGLTQNFHLLSWGPHITPCELARSFISMLDKAAYLKYTHFLCAHTHALTHTHTCKRENIFLRHFSPWLPPPQEWNNCVCILFVDKDTFLFA